MLQLPTFTFWTPTLSYVLLYVLVVTTFSVAGLVTIWAGLGRGHWFFRMPVVLALIAAPLIIPIHSLVVLFFLQSVLTLLPLFILRRARRPSVPEDPKESAPATLGRAQLSLRDLLLMTVIVAGLSAILAQVPREVRGMGPPLVLGGMGLAVTTLGGAWIGLRRGRSWLRLVLFALLIAVGVAAMFYAPYWVRLAVLNVLFPLIVIATFLSLVRTASGSEDEATRSPWVRRFAGASAVLLSLLILLPPALAGYRLSIRRPIPKTPVPVGPNSYSELIQTWQPLAGNATVPIASSPKSLKAFVAEHRSELDRMHAALEKPCWVPLRYDEKDMMDGLSNFSKARGIAMALDFEAMLAHHERRGDDFVRIVLDQFRLGNAVSRGGLLSDTRLGWLTESEAARRIAEYRKSFSADQCRALIEGLQKIEAEREPLEEVVARDEAWWDHVYSWDVRLGLLLDPSKSALKYSWKRRQAQRQMLLGELALCVYRQEQGRLPAELTDLVPQYLPAVPQDPFSGKPLIYRRTSTGHLLYSVGHNEEDDGGQSGIPKTCTLEADWGGDLLLDEPLADKSGGGIPASEKGKNTQR